MADRRRLPPWLTVVAALGLIGASPAGAAPVDRWAVHIRDASLRFGIPASWIRRVMEVESGGLTHRGGQPVVSRAGAMGLMQLMPRTWREMQLRLGLGPDPHDPADNILAGTAYLRLMYDRFGYPGLFGAYNAGPARFADYAAGRRGLPAETRAYVAAIAPGTPVRRAGTTGPSRMLVPALFAHLADGQPRQASPSPEPARSGLFVPLSAARAR